MKRYHFSTKWFFWQREILQILRNYNWNYQIDVIMKPLCDANLDYKLWIIGLPQAIENIAIFLPSLLGAKLCTYFVLCILILYLKILLRYGWRGVEAVLVSCVSGLPGSSVSCLEGVVASIKSMTCLLISSKGFD